MVATVGSISVDLAVKSAAFEAGFKKAGTTVERESSRMAKAVGGANKAFAGFFGGLGGVGGLGALAGIASFTGALGKARQALAEFDDIAKQARITGLGTDTFQALSFGALEASVNQETLNSALEIFAKNVGLAKSGNGALVSGLKELNPELLKNIVNAKSQEERLRLVADAMNRTSDATERAALSQAAFGKGGIEMVEVLGKGAMAIDDFKKRAADLGLIVPDDLLQRAGELDDKLVILAKVIDVNLNQALVNLAPLLVASAEGMARFSQDLNKSAAALTAFVNDPSLATFQKFLESPAGLQVNFDEGGIADWFRDLAAASKRTAVAVTSDIEAIKSQIKALEALAATDADFFALESLREELVRLNYELRAVDASPIKDIGTEADIAGDKVEKLVAGVTRLGGVDLTLPPGGGSNVRYPAVTAPPTSITVPSLFNETLQEAMQYDIGFASGGMIHPGDTQPVSFFKSPDEAVGVFTPAQMDAIGDAMGGTTVNMGGITINLPPGSDPMAPRSQLALLDAVERRVKQALSRP